MQEAIKIIRHEKQLQEAALVSAREMLASVKTEMQRVEALIEQHTRSISQLSSLLEMAGDRTSHGKR